MKKVRENYFLAANSAEGFVSHFGDCYDCFDGWRAYIIKGGPGTGKSSLMKRVALRAQTLGTEGVLCPCSSDPESLDAVIFEDLKTVILDGTAPHIVEPKFPGACENIINLGDCWDSDTLYKNRKEIENITLKNKLLHKSASTYLKAAGHFLKDNIALAEPYKNETMLEAFAFNLFKRLVPKKSEFAPKEWVRFISGITPKGIINFDFVAENYKTRIIIKDDYSVCANQILKNIRELALSSGYEIITLKNSFLPSLIIDHILIPELSLCFLTENSYISFGFDDRRIHARRFLDIAAINRQREKRRFNKKAFEEIVSSAAKILGEAKAVHDELEAYYIKAMDFDKTAALSQKIMAEIMQI